MDIQTARAGGAVAAKLDALDVIIGKLMQGLEEGWDVIALEVRDAENRVHNLVLGVPAKETSAGAMQFALSIYQAQREALTAELEALAA